MSTFDSIRQYVRRPQPMWLGLLITLAAMTLVVPAVHAANDHDDAAATRASADDDSALGSEDPDSDVTVDDTNEPIDQAAEALQTPATTTAPAATSPTSIPTDTELATPSPLDEKSPIYVVQFKQPGRLVRDAGISRSMLRVMLASGISSLARTATIDDALRKLFKPTDVILFKFDYSADRVLETNSAIAEELLRLFIAADFKPEQMIFVGVTLNDVSLPKLAPPPFGWTQTVNFRSGQDEFAAVLAKATAIVNVPTLRADPILAIAGTMKNLTYGFARHPARFLKNHCTPYICDMYQLSMIQPKVRLNIVNGIRILIDPDNFDDPDATISHETLVFAFDPIAADAYALEILERLRGSAGLPPLVAHREFPPYLVLAAQREFGHYHPDRLEPRRIMP